MKRTTLVLVAAVATIAVASPYVFGLLTQRTLNSSGVMADADLGIYYDSDCTQTMTSINWGICFVNENKTNMFYIKNHGTVNVTLSFGTDNWYPSAAETSYLLYSDFVGQSLQPDQVLYTSFTLYPLSNASQYDAFSFDILIQGQS